MTRTIRLLFILTIVYLLHTVVPYAAEGTWRTYVNSNSINDIAVTGNYVWCATYAGGIIRWDRRTGSYDRFTTSDGLLRNTHRVVAADDRGTVWFASGSRLERFDGTGFSQIPLPDVNVQAIAVDDDDTIWLGTLKNGVIHYNGSTYETYTTNEGLADNEVKAIEIDRKGALWFGTINGVSKFDGGEWTTYTMDDGLSGWYIYDIAEDLSGTLWFATNGGISSYDGKDWKKYPVADKLNTVYARKIAIGPGGDVWAGYSDGWDRYITRFDGVSWTSYKRETPVFFYGEFTSLACDDNGNVWIGIRRGTLDSPCLFMFDGTGWTSYMTEKEPLGEGFGVLVSDKNGVDWFTTVLGVARYDGMEWKLFTNSDIGTSSDVYRLTVDMDNTVWGVSIDGPISFDGAEWKIYHDVGADSGRINSVIVDAHNVKWFGAERGLVSYDGNAWTQYTSENSGISGSPGILGVDHENVLWLKTTSGVVSFNGNDWRQHTSDNSPHANELSKFVIDRDNVKWFVLDSVGVVSYDGSEWRTYTSEDGLAMSYVKDIEVDDDNVKWFCDGYGHSVVRNGVTSFDGTTWKNYTTRDGLATNGVNDIAVDRNNVKWFAMYLGGVTSFDGKIWETYTSGDGLIDGGILQIAVDNRNVKWFSGFLQGTASSFEDETITTVTQPDKSMSPLSITGIFPNPFNYRTTINIYSHHELNAGIKIYNLLGQTIRNFAKINLMSGVNSVTWDGKNDSGQIVSSGIYFFLLEDGKYSAIAKMMFVP